MADEVRAGFTRICGDEVRGKEEEFDAGVSVAEPIEQRAVLLRRGPADNHRGIRGAHKRGGVAKVSRGEDLIPGLFQQSAEIGKQIRGVLHAQDF